MVFGPPENQCRPGNTATVSRGWWSDKPFSKAWERTDNGNRSHTLHRFKVREHHQSCKGHGYLWIDNHTWKGILMGLKLGMRKIDHQEFQVPKMEVLNLIRLFLGWVFPYISRIHTAYIGEYLHFRYLKCLVNWGFVDIMYTYRTPFLPAFCGGEHNQEPIHGANSSKIWGSIWVLGICIFVYTPEN